jgi:hypothetical protein
MKHQESNLQQQSVKWFRYAYPKFIIFAIPNGSQRNVITASILKAEGVLSGVSDLFLMEPRKGFHGLFIEMKIKPNKTTKEQDWFLQAAHQRGYKCAICYSFDEFKNEIENYLK